MAAGKADIYIEQGANFFMRLTLKDSDGNARDLTGRSFIGQIRKSASSPDVLASFRFSVLDQTNPSYWGQVDVTLLPLDTAAISLPGGYGAQKSVSQYAYDINSSTGVNDVIRELEGVASVSPEVTRAT